MAEDSLEAILNDAEDDEKESGTFKRLRKLIEKQNASLTERDAAIQTLKGSNRTRDAKDALKALGVRESLAKYLLKDLEPDAEVTEEAVKKWVEENAEDFGVTLGATGDGEGNAAGADEGAAGNAKPAIADAARRISGATDKGSGPGGTTVEDLIQKIKSTPADRDELDKLYAQLSGLV